MKKCSDRRKHCRKLANTPGLHLEPHERQKYLSQKQLAACEAADVEMERARLEQVEVVNRCGRKLARLREHLAEQKRGEEFASFRFCSERYAAQGYPADGYQQEGFPMGGVYAQDEDDREAFIDAKLKEEGLTHE